MSRITSLSSSLLDMIVLLADGNPGACCAMGELASTAENVDPDSALGAFGPILSLDTHEIYGPDIWVLFKDICGQSAVKTQAVLRAIQLGIVGEREIKSGIAVWRLGSDRSGNDARVQQLLEAVQERLPRFAASVDTRPKDEDPAQTGASLASGAVPAEERADAQTPPSESPL